MFKKLLQAVPVAVILFVQVFTGLRGIDYGEHWDEFKQILLVEHTLYTGNIQHGFYNYPSVSYWLTLSALTPHVAGAIGEIGFDFKEIRFHLRNYVVDNAAYHLQARTVFLLVSTLASLWLYLAVRAMGRPYWEGLLAAGLLGFSWEANYHARWIAPDTVLMQFSALTLLLTALTLHRPEQKHWGILAVIAAGLAASTKYTGGALIFPVVWVFLQQWKGTVPARQQVLLLTGVGLLFAFTYLLTTPGTLLEPGEFLADIRFEMEHYATGHYGRSIEPGIGHLARIGIYAFLVFFSNFDSAACLLSAPAVFAAVSLWNHDRRDFVLLTALPVGLALYFSSQRIMSARNLLFLMPFLAVLAARGTFLIGNRLRKAWLQAAWAGTVVLVLLANGFWLFHAAESIAQRGPERLLSDFLAYAENQPPGSLLVGRGIWEAALAAGSPPLSLSRNETSETESAALFYSDAERDAIDWPLGLPKPYMRMFGPLDVNLDYYPGWLASEHILVLPIDKARAFGVIELLK